MENIKIIVFLQLFALFVFGVCHLFMTHPLEEIIKLHVLVFFSSVGGLFVADVYEWWMSL